MPVDFPGILDCEQELSRDPFNLGAGGLKRRRDVRDRDRSDEFRVRFHKGVRGFRGRWLADRVCHVDREKIRVWEETIHGLQADVIRIDMPASRPAASFYGSLSSGQHARRFRADEAVLAIGLIPNRHHFEAILRNEFAGSQLRLRLMRKAVANTDGEFFENEHGERARRYKAAQSDEKAEPQAPACLEALLRVRQIRELCKTREVLATLLEVLIVTLLEVLLWFVLWPVAMLVCTPFIFLAAGFSVMTGRKSFPAALADGYTLVSRIWKRWVS